jgi:hypothetical protein
VPDQPLSDEKRDEIMAMERGTRPDPSEYLSKEYIEQHLHKFDDGASRLMIGKNFDAYGISQRDGTSFVMPRHEADALVEATAGNPRALERSLGLPEGFFDDDRIVRVDIPNPQDYNLRVPSGNEAGANDRWIPGGVLPDGTSEAVIDGKLVTPDHYERNDIEW